MEKSLSMDVVNVAAAGIDVGATSYFVSIGQQADQVREFGVYTEDHQGLIKWLKSAKIVSVAMESTGSYWQTLFSSLQNAGFSVLLVNGKYTKNVKGKKTDVLDCMWIQKLHSLGLLSGSFLPDEHIRELQSYYHHRQYLIRQSASYMQKMQQALRLMNLRLDVVLSDITGLTGTAIIEAILKGERDPVCLANLAHHRVKKSKAEIALALQGEWKEDQLFLLEECYQFYCYYRVKVKESDKKIEGLLKRVLIGKPPLVDLPKIKRKRKHKNTPTFELRPIAYHFFGVDLYQIDGISDGTLLCILCMLGNGVDHFPTAKHFVSWLKLAPNNKISGGKILNSRTPKGKNKLSLALRQAANVIGNMKDHPLSNFFSRIAYRKGRGAAITATARKLATIIYHLITKKEAFDPNHYNAHKTNHRKKNIRSLQRKIASLGLTDQEKTFVFG